MCAHFNASLVNLRSPWTVGRQSNKYKKTKLIAKISKSGAASCGAPRFSDVDGVNLRQVAFLSIW